jgi:hypothetical protein
MIRGLSPGGWGRALNAPDWQPRFPCGELRKSGGLFLIRLPGGPARFLRGGNLPAGR